MNGHFAGCGRYRGSLVDFVDRRDQGPDTAAALEHLDRCAHCRSELEATALAITALRRLGADARASEPGADAWQRVRNRIAERGAVWRWRSSVAGLAVGAALVATVIAPAAMWQHSVATLQEVGLDPQHLLDRRHAEERAEQRIIAEQRLIRSTPVAPAAYGADRATLGLDTVASDHWAGPDGLGLATPTLTTSPVDRTK